jgi:hypothetical protein
MSASLGQDAVLDRRVSSLPQKMYFILSSVATEFETEIVIKFNFQSISFVIFLYVMYYASLLQ